MYIQNMKYISFTALSLWSLNRLYAFAVCSNFELITLIRDLFLSDTKGRETYCAKCLCVAISNVD